MKQQEARTDPFRRLAQKVGFKSRSAFKLVEMDRRFKLLNNGSRVVDLGSAPGSWLQVASQNVGSEGLVVGVDVSPVNVSAKNVRFVREDIRSPGLPEKLLSTVGTKLDLLLLDAAPKFSGVPELDVERQVELIRAGIQIADGVLRKQSRAVFKALEGHETKEIESLLRSKFAQVLRYRPKAVRKHSREFYFVCIGFRG